jgi:hypothetical protein
MGRDFKLKGYTTGGGDESFLSRIGGMAEGSISNLKRDDPALGNNNLVLDQASVFYGGKIFNQLGAFIQTTYDGVANQFLVDDVDIRSSDEIEIYDQQLIYGVDFNNGPTTQDLWNTTPAWGYPYTSSPVTNNPAASPIIANLNGQVGGASLYSLIADTLYLEAGAYTSFAKYAQKGLGQWDTSAPNYTANSGAVKLNGGSPYWRVALQRDNHGHYFSLGHFGFMATVQADATIPAFDKYRDIGFDFNYQYLVNPLHILELKASYINENQSLLATSNAGGAAQVNQNLSFVGINGSYTYAQTYSLTAGFNHIYGNGDAILYAAAPTNTPNSEYFTFELDYVPFGKTASTGLASYLNLRFAAQYVAYTQFDGGVKNYDGAGRNASDNNTLYFNSWLAF